MRSGIFESHHHVRAGNTADIQHAWRAFVAGRAVGLVLAGGGGARTSPISACSRR